MQINMTTTPATLAVTNAHGLFKVRPMALDLVMAKYLPNSINGLRAIINDREPDVDISDVHTVTECLAILADMEYAEI